MSILKKFNFKRNLTIFETNKNALSSKQKDDEVEIERKNEKFDNILQGFKKLRGILMKREEKSSPEMGKIFQEVFTPQSQISQTISPAITSESVEKGEKHHKPTKVKGRVKNKLTK